MVKKCAQCQSKHLDDVFLMGSNIFVESKSQGRELGQTKVDAKACMDCGYVNLWMTEGYYD